MVKLQALGVCLSGDGESSLTRIADPARSERIHKKGRRRFPCAGPV